MAQFWIVCERWKNSHDILLRPHDKTMELQNCNRHKILESLASVDGVRWRWWLLIVTKLFDLSFNFPPSTIRKMWDGREFENEANNFRNVTCQDKNGKKLGKKCSEIFLMACGSILRLTKIHSHVFHFYIKVLSSMGKVLIILIHENKGRRLFGWCRQAWFRMRISQVKFSHSMKIRPGRTIWVKWNHLMVFIMQMRRSQRHSCVIYIFHNLSLPRIQSAHTTNKKTQQNTLPTTK